MVNSRTSHGAHPQQGVISLLVLLVLMAGVILVQMQSMQISSGNSLGTQQSQDNLAALYLAESGLERAIGSLTLAANANPASFQSVCNGHVNAGSFALGDGLFQYLDPLQPATPTFCALKVEGVVRSARRVLQTGLSYTPSAGDVGYGRHIVSGMSNPHNVGSVGLFHLAWRRHGSTGHHTSGGNASASSCAWPECSPQWNIESSSGSPSVGSLGTALNLGPHAIGQITQTLSADRNYVGVGINLPGVTGPPLIQGSFADDKRTANTEHDAVTTGDTSSGEANLWCHAADTLVLGISGRGDNDVRAAFTAVVFNTHGSPAQAMAMTRIAHSPNTDGTSANAFGDVFSEIWTTHNPHVYAANASSSNTTVTLASPITVKAGTVLQVYSGTGAFAGHTRVVHNVNNGTQFEVDRTPTTPLRNATVCGGICALFNRPASSSAKTEFTVTRNAGADKEWAAGFTCLSGVDPTRIEVVSSSGVRLSTWREVVTHE